ncbi:MAG: tRNA glutamyl-Q(34) synthetase GluQRS [Gammaproteobacteria bacterium]|nr:MAG: tRNA glutamyl-Q(34) synthetase GluQRS [Gammaproteobacteria bacterium]
MATPYRGRFAPSPSGPLHFGSLVAALASYLDARHHRGTWLVRIDDIDGPRTVAGAAEHIIDSLAAHGLYSDEPVFYQSQQDARYTRALDTLKTRKLLYACDCTRKRLKGLGAYDGYCRNRQGEVGSPAALRVRVAEQTHIRFNDGFAGPQHCRLDTDSGDFIVKRKDGLWAYQLAAAVDDGDSQRITHVVRGADLLPTTAKQIYLQGLLGINTPEYLHVPIALDKHGNKLSKQNHAAPLDNSSALANLREALAFLKQTPPPPTIDTVPALLETAVRQWNRSALQTRYNNSSSP